MTEIITRPQADLLLNVVLALGIVLGVVGALAARLQKASPVWGAAIWGGPLVLARVLWSVYNALTDRLGQDSVLNLAINAVLFVIVGAVCGLAWARFDGRQEETGETPSKPEVN